MTPPTPPQTHPQSLAKPILIAGLLGGIFGGLLTFAASRLFKPANSPKPEMVVAVPADARKVAEGFVTKLREGRYEDFILDVKTARVDTEKDFGGFRDRFLQSRELYRGVYGTPTGECDLLRESALSPSLAKFVYLEKFNRGAVVWFFVLYHDTERWRLNEIVWNTNLSAAFVSGQ